MSPADIHRPHGGVCNQITLRRYGWRWAPERGVTPQSDEADEVGDGTEGVEGSFDDDPDPSLDLDGSLAFDPSLFLEELEEARASVL
jgi:hypothetical protein